MEKLIREHLAAYASDRWDDYRALLDDNVEYEEMATRQRAKGADEYIKQVQRWKRAFPDLRARVIDIAEMGDKVITEVEWQGTHNGSFDGPFGTVPATNKRGQVRAVIVSTVRDGKIVRTRHYFDLLTVLGQIGIAPVASTTTSEAAARVALKH